jgi:hypothetical protein
VALFAFGALFLKGANDITAPWWAPNLLTISAVAVVAIGSTAVFLLLTIFRPQTLSDDAYLQWQVTERAFRGFQPEQKQRDADMTAAVASLEGRRAAELEQLRSQEYKRTSGLFLSHTWRPSQIAGQQADITIRLHQHGSRPLPEGKVSQVEYELGRKFFPEPVIKTDPRDDFRLDVSAYAPVLCLARVHFTTNRAPLELFRYLDFPEDAIADVIPSAA